MGMGREFLPKQGPVPVATLAIEGSVATCVYRAPVAELFPAGAGAHRRFLLNHGRPRHGDWCSLINGRASSTAGSITRVQLGGTENGNLLKTGIMGIPFHVLSPVSGDQVANGTRKPTIGGLEDGCECERGDVRNSHPTSDDFQRITASYQLPVSFDHEELGMMGTWRLRLVSPFHPHRAPFVSCRNERIRSRRGSG